VRFRLLAFVSSAHFFRRRGNLESQDMCNWSVADWTREILSRVQRTYLLAGVGLRAVFSGGLPLN
jgi:hypothetical protein